jgi:hypothetical protein
MDWMCFHLLMLSDEAIKQILIWQNEKLPSNEQFIIADLDSRHLLVKTTEKENIEEALNEEVSRLSLSSVRC